MFGLGVGELLVILLVVLVVFGPGKIPELGKALGEGMRDFQRALRTPAERDITPPQESTEDSSKEPDKS